MRAILESYDSELGPTEYSPQLSKRLKEAEDVLQRTQTHNVELEVRDPHSNAPDLVRSSSPVSSSQKRLFNCSFSV